MHHSRRLTGFITLFLVFTCDAIVSAGDEQPSESPPNVLLIIADDLTYTALGCYGNDHVNTPNIDALARRGMLFKRMYCQFPVCGPSRASFLSGMYPPTIGVQSNGMASRINKVLSGNLVSMPEQFKNHGYTTARISKLFHMAIPAHITRGVAGPDHRASWSRTFNCKSPEWMTTGEAHHYSNETLIFDSKDHENLGFGTAFYAVKTNTDGSEQPDVMASEKACEWLEDLKDGPFFLAVGFVRPHVPLVATSKYFDMYDADRLPLPERPAGDWDDIPAIGLSRHEVLRGLTNDKTRRDVIKAYYASVSFMDAQVGKVVKKLETLGLRDNTIVVFTSDHGYHLGEHGMWQKMNLHDESASAPLIIALPDMKHEARQITSDSLCELIDLFPTLCDLAGLPIPAHCQGVSLRPIIEDPTATVRRDTITLNGRGMLLRTDQYAYMRYIEGSEELYDMKADPKQFKNLASDEKYADIVATMRERLQARRNAMN